MSAVQADGPTESAKPCAWLVMLYMAADNNLSEDMVLALQDLQAEEPPQGCRIVAQFDPSGLGLATQRYDFNREWPGDGISRHLDPSYHATEVNTGNVNSLTGFIKWAVERYGQPDTRYLPDPVRPRQRDHRRLLPARRQLDGLVDH